MKLSWQIEPEDVERVAAFYGEYESHSFVLKRKRRNLESPRPEITRAVVWEVLVSCLLTTQQRSGSESQIQKFLDVKPFPLSYDFCLNCKGLNSEAHNIFKKFGGIRRGPTIAGEIQTNLSILEKSLWPELLQRMEQLKAGPDARLEKQAAHFIDESLKGFGPKQSRNLMQWLGLSRYEIPIDSRVTKWLNQFGFPMQISAAALSIPACYDLISEGIQALCARANIMPCLLDAAIFVSLERQAGAALTNS